MTVKGLSKIEVEKRIENGQINHFHNPNDMTIKKIIKNNVFTFFNLIILILALLVISAGVYKNLMFVGVAICNMFIGIVQEIRAKKTLDRLNIIAEAKILTLRDDREVPLPISEIVLDDILHLKSGNQIVCDSIVESGSLEVNESLLTGEPDIIEKNAGDELYSGSFIVSGDAYVKVIHVGKDNFSSKIMLKAKSNKKQKSVLQENIDVILKLISMIILPLGILLFLTQFLINHSSYSDSIIGTVAGVSGMIPEGLVLLTTISLALGVIELSKKQTLVHNIYCIETLAHVDVLCLDKTGTLTEGRMRVEKVYQLNDDDPIDKNMKQLLSSLNDENATSLALREFFKINTYDYPAVRKIPFSSERKYSGAVYEDCTLLMGAIEFLFPDSQDHLKKIIETHTTDGMRVIVLAKSHTQIQGYQLPEDLDPLGLIVISDCIRANAKDTLDYFEKQGVDIRIISGDAPATVSLIARRVGVKNADNYIDASTLTSQEMIEEAVSQYTIFGRVSPSQKKELVMALQKAGHTVGMTGDGVNDVMALKQADCSIAMAEGSEAAKEVSNIVLLDSDFSHLPSVLAEGRKVIHHIQNAASLFLVKTIFSVLITFMTMISFTQYPFEPIQLTFIGSVAIGIPSFFLTLEKDYSLVEGKFIINVLSKAVPGALSIFLEVLIISVFCKVFGYPHEVRSTMSVLVTDLCIMLVLKKIYPLNSFYRRLVFGSMSVVAVVGLVFLHELFEMVVLDMFCFATVLALFALAFIFSHYFNLLSHDMLVYLEKKLVQFRKKHPAK